MFFYRWVIDANIFISYCISARLDELPALIEKYNLELCSNEELIIEFTDVIHREAIRKFLKREPDYYIEIIQRFLRSYPVSSSFTGSPDPNDDYLIGLVLETKAVGLVTGDKALLKWHNPPIQIISWKNFQLTYPV
jgi:putative PIN family toxin of toxin-antitoxin system